MSRKSPHSMGEVRAIDLPGKGMFGIQGEKGNRVAFIEYDYALAEGNAEELELRWNSWEVGGAFDSLIKSSQALLATHRLLVDEALKLVQESRRRAALPPKSSADRE